MKQLLLIAFVIMAMIGAKLLSDHGSHVAYICGFTYVMGFIVGKLSNEC